MASIQDDLEKALGEPGRPGLSRAQIALIKGQIDSAPGRRGAPSIPDDPPPTDRSRVRRQPRSLQAFLTAAIGLGVAFTAACSNVASQRGDVHSQLEELDDAVQRDIEDFRSRSPEENLAEAGEMARREVEDLLDEAAMMGNDPSYAEAFPSEQCRSLGKADLAVSEDGRRIIIGVVGQRTFDGVPDVFNGYRIVEFGAPIIHTAEDGGLAVVAIHDVPIGTTAFCGEEGVHFADVHAAGTLDGASRQKEIGLV